MWANAQRDGRPAEYRWRPLFNAMCGSMVNVQSPTAEIRRGIKKIEERNQKYNVRICYTGRP